MGIFSIANQHVRFAIKLACAIVLALFVGFHFNLETPRWAAVSYTHLTLPTICSV